MNAGMRMRIGTRLRAHRGALGLVVLAATVIVPVKGASASCAAPQLGLAGTPTSAVQLGHPLTVRGRGFVHGCDDTGSGTTGGCAPGPGETETPIGGVRLLLRQDGRTWRLGTADAGTAQHNRLGHVSWRVRIPGGAHPGPATLRAGTARLPVTLVVTALP